MRETKTVEQLKCDICYSDIRDSSYYRLYLNNAAWDVCLKCINKFALIQTFLTMQVGLDISFTVQVRRDDL